MEKILKVEELRKTFRTKTKEPGFRGSMKSLFNPVYKETEAVSGISFEVSEGEMIAFIGPNGAGKSTTIKMITGILYPTSGNVSVMGMTPWTDRKKLSYKIGSVFGQKSQMWFHLPPEDTFELMGDIYEIDRSEYRKRLSELVKKFQLEELMNTPVRKLSLGQRIRCEIAVSLIHKPKVLLLDEPTIGLDVVVKNQIRELIKDINKKEGLTVFLTSHDVGDIEKLCKRVLVIDHGKLIMENDVPGLKYKYLSKKIVSFKLDEAYVPDIEGVKIIKQNGTGLKAEIDTKVSSVQKLMENIMKNTSIVDMNISETPMEEIIENIYTGGGDYGKD
ncbi:MAG: ATP-binding cassette domain-containing protein [Thermotogae bacterium]|nr:ATP-binding cassette domain-containing protein [Thermotogota bacterium]